MKIGNQINQLRKLAGMTQEQLAEKLNVSRQTISKWEAGTTLPDLDSIVKLSQMFHISLDDLLLEEKSNMAKQDEKMTLEDLMKINLHNRRMTLLLMSGLIFLMVSALAAVFVVALSFTTGSIEYMLYRYITVGEYAYAPVNYMILLLPSIVAGIIGIVLCLCYAVGNKNKGQKGNSSKF